MRNINDVLEGDMSRWFQKGERLRWLTFVIVLAAIALPRAMALDWFVTPDEHLWVTRSANFYYALG
jgi:hypothetical protein